MGLMTRFGHYHPIANQQIVFSRVEQMPLKEQPERQRPRYHAVVPTLYCPVAASCVCPSRDVQHRHPPCHAYYGGDDVAHLPYGCRGHVWVETFQKC
jgi:hypothetical protein